MPKLVQRSRYTPTKGVDLKSSDRNRTEDYLTGGQNMRYDENFNLSKRFGFQKIAYGTEVIGGIREFTTTDYKGATKTELIGFGKYPYRLVKAYSTVTNSTGGIIYLDMRYSTTASKWYFTITNAAGAVLLSYDMTGKHVDDLVAAIEALANITCVTPVTPSTWVTKSVSIPAEYSELMELEPLANAGTRNLEWYFWEKINTSTWGSVAIFNQGDVSVANNTFSNTNAQVVDGDIVRFSGDKNWDATPLPDPLAQDTNYYVVSSAGGVFKVSAMLGGAEINIADDGDGPFAMLLFGGQPIYHQTTSSEYIIPSSVSISNRLFVSTAPRENAQSTIISEATSGLYDGWNNQKYSGNQKHVCKYDGQTFYRTHAPSINPWVTQLTDGVNPNVAPPTYDARGTLAGLFGAAIGSRKYKFTYLAVDKTGNITESRNTVETTQGAAGEYVYIHWPSDNFYCSGFNDHYAIVDGNQAATLAVTVDAGHTFVAGDIAYFYDYVQTRFVSREVLSVAATTVTLSGTPIQANDIGGNIGVKTEALMSPNTRMAIWRTKSAASGDFYLVAEVPFVFGLNIFTRDPVSLWPTSKPVFCDDIGDAYLGAVFISQQETKYIPPYGNILSSHNGIFCVAGVSEARDTMFFSSADDIEAFPLATNSFNIDAEIIAAGQSGPSLGVFSKTKTNIVTGDLASFNFRVEKLSENVGCNSHASIQEVEEGVIFFQTEKGPYMLINGRQLAPVGKHSSGASLIEPYFTANYAAVTTVGAPASFPRFQNSIAAASGKWSQYALNVPWTTASYLSSGLPGLPSTLVYDYRNQSWCPFWEGVEAEFTRGVCFFGDELFGLSSGSTQTLYKQITKKGTLNYGDHAYPIWGYAETFWDSLKSPDIYKKYLWLTLSGSETCASTTWGVRVQTYLNYSSAADHSDFTLSFSITGPPQEQKLKAAKANSIKFRFSNETMYEDFAIQGWMYEVAGALKEQSSSWGNQNR